MRWSPGGRSRNLEDRRGASGAGGDAGGGRPPGLKVGLGGIIILLLLSLVFKRDLVTPFLGGGAGAPGALATPGAEAPAPLTDPAEEELVRFMSFVLDDAQGDWGRRLQGYRDAKLVLFRDAVQSACGFAGSATGPFYCPGDEKVYLDLSFFDQLHRQFGAPGDFAQAYVLAHEIGHHVQNLVGTERELRTRQRAQPGMANRLSVAMELQADCYAGVWANGAAKAGRLEPGDLDEGLAAASAVGDDRLQQMGTGRVQPESFTHGTSAQRREWFRRGFDAGDPNRCDSFGALGLR
jgi:predicted metalloprotease